MKALTNKVKSAYSMAKRFVKNTFGAYASTKSTFSSPSSKQKTVTGKIKSFFHHSMFRLVQQHQQRVQNMGIGKRGQQDMQILK